MLLELLGNFAVIGFFVAIWANFQDWSLAQARARSALVLGSLMGVAAIAAMLFSSEISPGVHFDLRSVAIAIAAVFGGPIAGLAAAVFAAAYRTFLGGAGLESGLLSIAMTLLAGLIGHELARRRHRPGIKAILITTVLLGVLPMLSIAALPAHIRTPTMQGAVPVVSLLSMLAFASASWAISRNADLARTRALLVAAIRQAPELLYVKDPSSQIVAANRNCAVANSYDRPEQLVGKSDFDLTIHGRATELFDEEQQAMVTGLPIIDKLEEVPGPDRRPKYYSTSKSVITLGNGEVAGIVGVTKDITSIKSAEREIKDSHDSLAFVLEEMTDGVALIGHDGYFRMTNRKYRELFPVTGERRIAGAYLPDILDASLAEGEQVSADVAQGRDAWVSQIMHTLRAGGEEIVHLSDERWFQIRTKPHEQGMSTVVVTDISAMKRAEIELLANTQRLARLSITDELTGLTNRRGFDMVLQNEVARARRNDTQTSVLLIDIDRFKQFNDRHGHVAGDSCLQSVAKAIGGCAKRATDLVARYGGEEFGVVLPETDAAAAALLAQDMRNAVGQLAIAHEDSATGTVSVSIGVAAMEGSDPQASSLNLLLRADVALYNAKESGRNTVSVAEIGERAVA